MSGASADAAALQAALTVMNNLYGSGSLYQQYRGVTGATYYPSIPGSAKALVGPTVAQMNNVAAQIGIINAQLAALGSRLAHKVARLRDIAMGEIVRWADVAVPESEAVLARRDMQRRFAASPAAIEAQ